VRYNTEAAVDTLPEGQYDAVVKVATDKVSKAGNEMIEVILTCYAENGIKRDVFDHLLATDDFQWKVRHFCESAGLDYKRGELNASECISRNVRVWLERKNEPGYGDKNKVRDYLPRATEVRVSDAPPDEASEDQDIPF